MIHYQLGIFYIHLKDLINDNRERITASRPLKLKLTYRKGELALRASVGRSVAWVPLGHQALEEARKFAVQSAGFLVNQVTHVEYEDAC